MSIFTRLVSRVRPRGLDRDLHDEVEFHIDMRTKANVEAGLNAEEAAKQAHQQFGDVEAVMANMRRERLTSLTVMLTLTAVVAVVVIWVAQQQLARMDLMMPAAPAAPRVLPPATLQDAVRAPHRSRALPPPGPGPTWEQYRKQTKAFEELEKGPGRYSPGRPLHEKADAH